MRRTTLSALALVTVTALAAAGCGGDDGDDPSPDAATTAASDRATETPGESASTADPSASATASESASDTTDTNAKVEETAGKLNCSAGPAIDGFEGETEYECGPYLIADWSTAGISEQEMFTAIDKWVDEDRPVWLYAGDMVIVYGTQANLEAVSSEFE